MENTAGNTDDKINAQKENTIVGNAYARADAVLSKNVHVWVRSYVWSSWYAVTPGAYVHFQN